MTALPSPQPDAAPAFTGLRLPTELVARGIGLRAEREEDLAFLRTLFAATFDDRLLATFPEAMRGALLEQQFQARRGHFRTHFSDARFALIEAQGTTVGRLCLSPGPKVHHVVDIAFLPAWQGRGLGGALLRAVQAEAAAAGAAVTLHVDMLNGGAQRLYHRLGFRLMADRPPNYLLQWQP